jgi:uncharacterized protein YjiS (DUF1127 family)
MNPKIVAQPRPFRGDSNWNESYRWLQPAKRQVGQSTASIFAYALSWLNNWPGRIGCACQVVRALPREVAIVGADDVLRAQQLLLGVENSLDDHSTTARATCRGATSPTGTLAARKQADGLIQRAWHALKRIREQDRLRDTLCRLSDRELADMGIHRSEFEDDVDTLRRDVEYFVMVGRSF